MFAWPTLGVLVGIAVPVAIILLVLAIFRIVQVQTERAVRSPDYWRRLPETRPDPTEEERDEDDRNGEPDGDSARRRTGDDE
ncbi:hypothetical protein ABZ635_09300 [Nocardiopsis sp. NPDC007018]|uniref:hypothetical protein n=1 Tax=Nocardiopsis sp. NPDC007018 TaxID=3155721 RepID=UPI0033E0D1CA